MPKVSAGLLVFKRTAGGLEVFLVHPGGPFFARKDAGAWSIPKGECDPGEDPFATAQREFTEETGFTVEGEFVSLGEVRQSSAKIVKAWAIEGDFDASKLTSNTFEMEYPPDSGRMREFPEVDRGAWFTLDQARVALNKGQQPLIAKLEAAG